MSLTTTTSLKSAIPSHEDLLIQGLDQKVAAHPHARNLDIFDKVICVYKSRYYAGKLCSDDYKPILEGEMKQLLAAFAMMKKEYIKRSGDISSGIAVLNFRFDKFGRQSSVVILFHSGEVFTNNKHQESYH